MQQNKAFVMVKIKEETYATEQGVGKATGRARRSLSRLVTWSLARHCCSSTSFVGSSDHLLSLELRQWVRRSCLCGVVCKLRWRCILSC